MSQQPDEQPDEKTTVHFEGPGQWHSQAVEIQEPEPDDEPGED